MSKLQASLSTPVYHTLTLVASVLFQIGAFKLNLLLI